MDNPNNLTKYDIVNYIANHLDTDTILYQANVSSEEYFLLPIIQLFQRKGGIFHHIWHDGIFAVSARVSSVTLIGVTFL